MNKDERRENREFYISVLRDDGLRDKALEGYTFENDNGQNPQMEKARKYISNWEKMYDNGIGLLLWGNTGTGKTFFAASVANALIDMGVPARMLTFGGILNDMTGEYAQRKNEYLDELNSYSMLILDDLGAERRSPFAAEIVYSVIDSRVKSKKPMIVTTNMPLTEIKTAPDITDRRIYDRILERCVPVMINGKNIRTQIARESFQAAKALLG